MLLSEDKVNKFYYKNYFPFASFIFISPSPLYGWCFHDQLSVM